MSKNGLNELYRELRELDEVVKPTLRAIPRPPVGLDVEAELHMALPRKVTARWTKDGPQKFPDLHEAPELHVKQLFRCSGPAAQDPEARRHFLTRILDVVSHKKNQALVALALDEDPPGIVEAQDEINERELNEKNESPVWGSFSDLVRETKDG